LASMDLRQDKFQPETLIKPDYYKNYEI
jgi:hypothetical protein